MLEEKGEGTHYNTLDSTVKVYPLWGLDLEGIINRWKGGPFVLLAECVVAKDILTFWSIVVVGGAVLSYSLFIAGEPREERTENRKYFVLAQSMLSFHPNTS